MATVNTKYRWYRTGVDNEQMTSSINLELTEKEALELYYLVTHAKNNINVPEIAHIRGVLSQIIDLT